MTTRTVGVAIATAAGLALLGAAPAPRAAERAAGTDRAVSQVAYRAGVVLLGIDENLSGTGGTFRGEAASGGSGMIQRVDATTQLQVVPPAPVLDAAARAIGTGAIEAVGPGLYSAAVIPGSEREAARRLAVVPGVAFADVDHRVTAFELPDDPRYSEQWGLREIGMPEAWAGARDASSVPVAILDTGVKVDHPDLAAALWSNPDEIAGNGLDDDGNGLVDDVHGWHYYQDFSTGRGVSRNNADLTDNHGHGTHTAGIVGAVGDNGVGVTGVAWRSRLMILRVLDDEGVGWESDIVRGLNYAVRNGALVANLSLGTPDTGRALEAAIGRAEDAGVVVVAAAGNDGGPISYPARDPRVIGVGATTTNARRASFSAYGPGLDVMAPGTAILSTWPAQPYHSASGTSAASPHVAGVAALMRAQQPELTPARLRDCLRLVARDLGEPGWDEKHGWGLLDAARSVRGCGEPLYLPLAAPGDGNGSAPLIP